MKVGDTVFYLRNEGIDDWNRGIEVTKVTEVAELQVKVESHGPNWVHNHYFYPTIDEALEAYTYEVEEILEEIEDARDLMHQEVEEVRKKLRDEVDESE